MTLPTIRNVDDAKRAARVAFYTATDRSTWTNLPWWPQRRARWDQVASSPSSGTAAKLAPPKSEAPRDQKAARQQGSDYVIHGSFGVKVAHSDDILLDEVARGIRRGSYERTEATQVGKLVEPGDRVIELGAGLGFLSALVISTIEVADYVAVEADPRLRDVIHRTHELNGLSGPLTVESCVATCGTDLIEAGTVDFFVSKKFCASSLHTVGRLKHTVSVPVVPLVDLIERHGSNVLVCDIEGAESDIFNGTDLGSIDKVMMEIHPRVLGQSGMLDLFRHLCEAAFVYDADLSIGNVVCFRKLPA
jgi:FkbM family methyltransferase